MKRTLTIILQCVVTSALLWWIFHDKEKNSEMLDALRQAQWLRLIPAILAIGSVCLIQTQRWHLFLRAQDISFGWWRELRVYMIGLFFNLFLLGSTGGDVVKIYYTLRETKTKKSAALLSVLVDRMMGLLGLVAVTVLVIALRWKQMMASDVTRGLLLLLTAVMGAMLAMIFFGFLMDRFRLTEKIPHRMPMRKTIVEYADAFSIYARDGGTLWATFALSMLSHILNFSVFYFAARALNAFEGWQGLIDVFCIMPIIMTIASLPISLSGVGVREGLFQKLFNSLYATPAAIAVPISILGFCTTVFWSLVGGIVYLFYRPSGGLHLTEMQAAIDEEKIPAP